MALGATIYKTSFSIADMDHHFYSDFDFTIAQHPSESNLRMMVRLIAFALNADEALGFTKGLSSDDEPELWKKSFGGDIELWIDIGQPDEKRIRKACGRSDEVIIYTYNPKASEAWWRQNESKLRRFENLSVVALSIEGDPETLLKRSMQLQANIQDGELLLIHDEKSITVTRNILQQQ